MALFFEICFYIGLLLAIAGLFWCLAQLVRGRLKKLALPFATLVLGIALIAVPAVISRAMVVDLGPRERVVQDERHITLTGWDRDGYDVLLGKTDTVVLQMANADVNDDTLQWLTGMAQLRELDLSDSAISDAGLAKLSALRALESLRLRGTQITDDGFREHILGMSSLVNVDVRQTMVLPETIEEWKGMQDGRRAFH